MTDQIPTKCIWVFFGWFPAKEYGWNQKNVFEITFYVPKMIYDKNTQILSPLTCFHPSLRPPSPQGGFCQTLYINLHYVRTVVWYISSYWLRIKYCTDLQSNFTCRLKIAAGRNICLISLLSNRDFAISLQHRRDIDIEIFVLYLLHCLSLLLLNSRLATSF